MSEEAIQIQELECLRCGHKWVPRVRKVRTCPSCRSPYWDTPKLMDNGPQSTKEKKDEARRN